MTITTRVYLGLTLIILCSFATFFSIGILMYCIIRNDEDLTGLSISVIFKSSGLTLISSASMMGLYRADAVTHQRRHRVVVRSEDYNADRIARVNLLYFLRLLGPVFTYAWRHATLIYVTLCVALLFLNSLTTTLFLAFMAGVFLYLMALLSCFMGPSIIRSLEITAEYETDDDIPTSYYTTSSSE